MTTPEIILASSSIYRQELLSRLGLPFKALAPNIDESAMPGEEPEELALRLAKEKAQALALKYPDAIVIGSDQVASVGKHILGKPGHLEAAKAQLSLMQNQKVKFDTALCVLFKNQVLLANIPTVCDVRPLTEQQIMSYLSREPAFDCAGSAKIEGLGITLMKQVESSDPTALIGLPLIRLTDFLIDLGIFPLDTPFSAL